MLPEAAYLQFTPDLRICRLLNGLWQISGSHGTIDPQQALAEMLTYHDAGFTTWDLADIYGPAEDFIGMFRQALIAQRGLDAARQIQAFTKWVPTPINRQLVVDAVERSLQRMQTQTLDLLQFHWWEYRFPGYLEALKYLTELRHAGKIRHLALTNFDTARLQKILANDIAIVSNQVQYSIIDERPEVQMIPLCREHNITLLTYGTLCGGLLSEKYLNQPEPTGSQLDTASLRKYKQMIDQWGGWALFQELLKVLQGIAERHQVTIGTVATRYILDKPAVAGVIVGTRLGISDHRAANARVFSFELTSDDLAQIREVTAQAHNLFKIIGDCGDEYRR